MIVINNALISVTQLLLFIIRAQKTYFLVRVIMRTAWYNFFF